MKNIWTYVKGLAMGAADVVPGVSGGTIAFITGIYDTLLQSINSFNIAGLKILIKEGVLPFWKHINGTFLFFLLGGIATSILSLAKLFTYLMENHPVGLWSFFFGLIAASIVYMHGQIKVRSVSIFVFFGIGMAISFYITIASPAQGPDALWYLFICGAIAICAMILPGISGSFILLLMGAYHTVLTALTSFDISKILAFMLGAIIGLLSFSRIVKFMLNRYRANTLAILTGFLAGSLNKVWPWKTHVENRINSKGKIVAFLDKNVMPADYSTPSDADIALGFIDKDPKLLFSILLMMLGFALVIILGKFGKTEAEKNKN
jgi:putative membrane protein